jgi:hypothetical protein
MSPRGMAVSNTKYLSSSETRVHAWHTRMEIASIWINLMPGICWWYLFHKLVKRSFSTAPDILKPLLKCSILKCISWLNGSFFGGEHRGFLKEGVKTYQTAPMSPSSQLANFLFLSAHLWSMGITVWISGHALRMRMRSSLRLRENFESLRLGDRQEYSDLLGRCFEIQLGSYRERVFPCRWHSQQFYQTIEQSDNNKFNNLWVFISGSAMVRKFP